MRQDYSSYIDEKRRRKGGDEYISGRITVITLTKGERRKEGECIISGRIEYIDEKRKEKRGRIYHIYERKKEGENCLLSCR